MWKKGLAAAILIGMSAGAPLSKAADAPNPDSPGQAMRDRQQGMIKALSNRGLLENYKRLETAAKLHGNSLKPKSTGQTVAPAWADAISREAAINLASLGFTSTDVATYGKRNVNLFDVADRVFTARGTSAEQMLMSDTVVVAKAGNNQTGRARSDGFLSATPFTVVKSLKGSRAPGDLVHVPHDSGINADGETVTYSHEANFEPGATYLLVLSKNWYEQRVAQQEKRAEIGFNATMYLAYQVNNDGTLRAGPKAARTGEAPKSIKAIENELAAFSMKGKKAGG